MAVGVVAVLTSILVGLGPVAGDVLSSLGKSCSTSCSNHDTSYYWCKTSKSWDYCSPKKGYDYEYNECKSSCSYRDYHYQWCYTSFFTKSWGYCSIVSKARNSATSNALSKVQSNWIESPKLTNWGSWGEAQYCPEGSIVTAVVCKTKGYLGSRLRSDDSALNGISVRCASPQDPYHIPKWVRSKEGGRGTWGSINECPLGSYAVGFQLRSTPEDYTNGDFVDEMGATDFKLHCRVPGSTELSTASCSGLNEGSWTSSRMCDEGFGVCGIQTQVEDIGVDDETGLNNVNFKCCLLPQS